MVWLPEEACFFFSVLLPQCSGFPSGPWAVSCRLSLSSYNGGRGDGLKQWLLFPLCRHHEKKLSQDSSKSFLWAQLQECANTSLYATPRGHTSTLAYSASSHFWKHFSCVFLQPYVESGRICHRCIVQMMLFIPKGICLSRYLSLLVCPETSNLWWAVLFSCKDGNIFTSFYISKLKPEVF